MRQEHVCETSNTSVAIPVHRLAESSEDSIRPRLPHDSPHPSCHLLPTANTNSHGYDVLRGLNEWDIERSGSHRRAESLGG